MRQVDGYVNKEDAEEALDLYAAMLRERGDTARFGVFIRHLYGAGWGVFLRDRNVQSKGYSPSTQWGDHRGDDPQDDVA